MMTVFHLCVFCLSPSYLRRRPLLPPRSERGRRLPGVAVPAASGSLPVPLGGGQPRRLDQVPGGPARHLALQQPRGLPERPLGHPGALGRGREGPLPADEGGRSRGTPSGLEKPHQPTEFLSPVWYNKVCVFFLQAPLPSNGDLKNDANIKDTILSQLKKLLTANLVVRLSNFTLWKVSTSKEKKEAKEFISGKEDLSQLPA